MAVKVLLLKRVAGPDGNWPAGTTIDVSESHAKDLESVGAAERLAKMVPYVEPAAKAPARETAIEKPAKKRETATEK